MRRILWLGLLALLALAACQNSDDTQSLAEALPADDHRPTFAFFFTDG